MLKNTVKKAESGISLDKNKKKVSVIIPCRNEVKHIENCVRNVYDFSPPEGGFEVIVVDGMSDDGTRDVLNILKQSYPDLVIIDNPRNTVPYAMNLGILHARGEYIVRADVRCTHPKGYLLDLLKLSEKKKADNVGGVLVPYPGDTYVQRSIALAYKSPLSMGSALRDRGDFVGETDTVYGGCFRRSRLLEIGMYDETMTRNQDDELSFRLRKNGGKIIQDGMIKVYYKPRGSLRQLFKQFMQYGFWKVTVIRKHPRQASLRHYLPALFVLGLLFFATAALFHRYAFYALMIYVAAYTVPIGIESMRIARHSGIGLWPGVVAAIFIIHVSFGIGFLSNTVLRFFKKKPAVFETLSR